MPSAQARIPTDRAGRYLTQLCRHLNQLRRHTQHGDATHGGMPQVRRVDWDDAHGVIELQSGTCTLDAGPDQLVINLEAADANELRRLQHLFAARLATIGRRDHVLVTW